MILLFSEKTKSPLSSSNETGAGMIEGDFSVVFPESVLHPAVVIFPE
jgi:hypothetical protein